ncbi:MAG: Multidrug resistance transporter, Bcr/CflA family [uncultured Rubellimicrobium sp.]|uniref:Bcr/CflA family efflux transporter n=1 Tax=uncultured Rubellimicrobium sp. TaxID=543078 RepID=A0A6J4NME9_9RHOB|nr:MAG: Multidrug resistance transporter, Bcr/CflA family [uncultured Rubellimicrobium sp.]
MLSPIFRTALVLGLLSAIGPFSIDMYLPAMPQIGAELGAQETQVQQTISLYFLSFGVAQFIWGPIADAYGRRLPLILGISLFAAATVACAFAPTIGWLIAARFVQGIGAAAVGVVPRAVVRDNYTGVEATRLMALIMLVISVGPMLAPLIGSLLLQFGSWRLIFGALLLVALMSLMVTLFALPETLAPKDRIPVNVRSMGKGLRRLLGSPSFMGLTMVGAFGFGSFFVFIASASFVYTETFNLSPTQFSLAFALNALGFFAASQAAAPLGARLGLSRSMRLALTGFATTTTVLLVLTLAGFGTLPVIMALLFVGNACLGLVMPATFVMALDEHGDIAGLASSLGGTLQMVTGSILVAATAPFFDGSPLPMVATICFCAVMAFLIGQWILSRSPRIAAPAE